MVCHQDKALVSVSDRGQRRKKERREERIGRQIPSELAVGWDEALDMEDGFDDNDIQVAKATFLSEAHATSPDKSSATTLRKRPCIDPLSETLSNDLEKEEEPIASETLEMIERLQKAKLLQSQIRELRKVTPPSNTFVSVKRPSGKRVSVEGRRAVLHCYELCREKKRTRNLLRHRIFFSRKAYYMGFSLNTVKNIVLKKDNGDARGMHLRYNHTLSFASDLRWVATEMNIKGQAVNVRVLFNRIKVLFVDQFKIPGKEAIRLLMKKVGFRYQDVRNTRNFVESEDIKAKRRHYLQERRSDKYKDAMFVYLDEPCCNQNHRGWLF